MSGGSHITEDGDVAVDNGNSHNGINFATRIKQFQEIRNNIVSILKHRHKYAKRTLLNDLAVDKDSDHDTVVAAKTVAINRVRHTGSIASSRALEIYGLDILAEGIQGHKQLLTEVQFLGVVEHPNLVKLIGYYALDGERGLKL